MSSSVIAVIAVIAVTVITVIVPIATGVGGDVANIVDDIFVVF